MYTGALCYSCLFAVGAIGHFLVGSYEREGASFFTDLRTQALQLALLHKAALCSNCIAAGRPRMVSSGTRLGFHATKRARSLSEYSVRWLCMRNPTLTIGSGSKISARSTISYGLRSSQNGSEGISPTGS